MYDVAIIARHGAHPPDRIRTVSAVSWNPDDAIGVALAHFSTQFIGWLPLRVLSVIPHDFKLRPKRGA